MYLWCFTRRRGTKGKQRALPIFEIPRVLPVDILFCFACSLFHIPDTLRLFFLHAALSAAAHLSGLFFLLPRPRPVFSLAPFPFPQVSHGHALFCPSPRSHFDTGATGKSAFPLTCPAKPLPASQSLNALTAGFPRLPPLCPSLQGAAFAPPSENHVSFAVSLSWRSFFSPCIPALHAAARFPAKRVLRYRVFSHAA